jgi:signal transduction histidine kinase
VLLGSALWTIGLLLAVSLVLVHLMYFYPRIMSTVHEILFHFTLIALAAVACMTAGAWQMRKGLSIMEQLRARLASVHKGQMRRLTGTYPAEVQPLVDDLNALLDQRERTVRRAVAKAGDLAHGLKTPLAVLSQEAQRAERSGHADVAASVGREVERMRTHIDYHLAHARAAASGATPGAHCLVRPSADALTRTLLQLHAERGLTIDVQIPLDHGVRCEREDLEEMLGNLLDNACKWARNRITIASSRSGANAIVIAVEDDGPGLDPALRERVLQRGVRADEAVPGTGLGLAIVGDLAELYEGAIELGESSRGGLSARLRLPAADHSGSESPVTKR